MVTSDIHGSAFYAEKMMRAFDMEQADKILILGDILYHGPRNELPYGYAPKEVIEILNEKKDCILAVRGNCDTEVDQMVLGFPILADYCVIVERTKKCENKFIYATHGHLYNENKMLPLQKGDVLLNGHTHVPKCIDYKSYVYMNPGSISIPKEGSEHSYMIIEDGICLWKNLDGAIYDKYTL